MNARHLLPALERQLRPHPLKLGGPSDASPERDPIQPFHDEARTDAVSRNQHVQHLRLRHARQTSRAHAQSLGFDAGDVVAFAVHAVRPSPQADVEDTAVEVRGHGDTEAGTSPCSPRR